MKTKKNRQDRNKNYTYVDHEYHKIFYFSANLKCINDLEKLSHSYKTMFPTFLMLIFLAKMHNTVRKQAMRIIRLKIRLK